jgi:tetratricopeptide (TPR) repeat protein
VAWGRERGIVFAEADGSLGEAYAQAALGQFDAARAILDRIRSLFAALPGRTSQYGETWALAGQVDRDAGDPEGALEKYARAIEFFWDIGNPTWWRGAAVMRAQTLLDLDRVDEAQGVLDQIATMSFTTYARTDSNELGARARIAARHGDVRAAVELAREGVGAIAGSGSPQAEGWARELLGNLLVAHGDEEDALVELHLAYDLYSTKAYRPGERRVASLLAALDGGENRRSAGSPTAGRHDRGGGTGVG